MKSGSPDFLLAPIRENVDLLGLVHIANVPGRCVPNHGKINYLKIYRSLERSGYHGWMAMEFLPAGDAENELRIASAQIR